MIDGIEKDLGNGFSLNVFSQFVGYGLCEDLRTDFVQVQYITT